MKNYNYYESVTEDIKEYIKENYSNIEEIDTSDLFDDLWIDDSVTGNGSGSYTFNTLKARDYVIDNMDLLKEVIKAYGIDLNDHLDDWEYLDVSIRCYVLDDCITKAMEELRN